MCSEHRHLTACQNQDRHNEPAGLVDIPARLEVHVMGIIDTCRDHRHLTTCQKQHGQSESAGQVDVPTKVEVPLMGNPRHM